MVYFGFVNMSIFEYSYLKVLLFLIYLHRYNYVLQNCFYVMIVVYMMVLLVVETLANPLMKIFEQRSVLLWIVYLFVVTLGFGVVKKGLNR